MQNSTSSTQLTSQYKANYCGQQEIICSSDYNVTMLPKELTASFFLKNQPPQKDNKSSLIVVLSKFIPKSTIYFSNLQNQSMADSQTDEWTR